jgi:hypothetical protein
VVDYAVFKQSCGAVIGKSLQQLLHLLDVLPVSSADCEREFRQMNLFHTSGRNRLLATSACDLLMVEINGPPLHAWNAEKYVISWLKAGHRGALHKATGIPKKDVVVKTSAKLFI